MSIRAMSLVWERSRAKGSNLLVLLAIADYAKDSGRDAWPSAKRLAKKGRLTDRAVRLVLHELERMGEIRIETNGTGRTAEDEEGRVVVPGWFIHIRCVNDWTAFERESGAAVFTSPPFDEGRPKNRKTFPENISDRRRGRSSKTGTTGTGNRIVGTEKPENERNPSIDPSVDPSLDPEEQGAAPPDHPVEAVENPDEHLDVITKLAHESIDLCGLTDLPEVVKARCASLHIPYDSGVVRKAIESAQWQRANRRQAGA